MTADEKPLCPFHLDYRPQYPVSARMLLAPYINRVKRELRYWDKHLKVHDREWAAGELRMIAALVEQP